MIISYSIVERSARTKTKDVSMKYGKSIGHFFRYAFLLCDSSTKPHPLHTFSKSEAHLFSTSKMWRKICNYFWYLIHTVLLFYAHKIVIRLSQTPFPFVGKEEITDNAWNILSSIVCRHTHTHTYRQARCRHSIIVSIMGDFYKRYVGIVTIRLLLIWICAHSFETFFVWVVRDAPVVEGCGVFPGWLFNWLSSLLEQTLRVVLNRPNGTCDDYICNIVL